MISHEVIEQRLQEKGNIDYVKVEGDGYHYNLTIVTNEFLGQSKLARQRFVYACLNDWIVSGEIHALTMSTWTTMEWEKQHG